MSVKITRGGLGYLPPGWAGGEEVPIGKRFRLSKPDRYTVLVAGNVGSLRLVAKPIIMDIGKPPPLVPAGQQAAGDAAQQSGRSAVAGKAIDNEWSRLVVQANRPLRGFQLHVQTSSVPRKSDHLIISLDWAGPISYGDQRAARLENYRFIVRDASENEVPLTEYGRAVFAEKLPLYSYAQPGETPGLVCRLSDLFSVKKGRDYKVLVVLPGFDAKEDDGHWPDGGGHLNVLPRSDAKKEPWVAGPISVHIPEPEVAGVTRPPYGSPKMWRKLVAMAAAPRADLVLKSEVGVGDSFVFFRTQLKRPEKESNPDPHAKAEQRPSAGSLPAWAIGIFPTNFVWSR